MKSCLKTFVIFGVCGVISLRCFGLGLGLSGGTSKKPKPLSSVYSKASEVAQKNEQYDVAIGNWFKAEAERKNENYEFTRLNWTGYHDLSEFYQAQGKFNQAIESINSALDKNAKDWFSQGPYGRPMSVGDIGKQYYYLGDIYLEQGKFAEAEEYYAKPTNGTPATDLLHNTALGHLFLQLGDYEKSRHYFQEALAYYTTRNEFRPIDIDQPKINLGIACYYAGDYAAAEMQFNEMANLNANSFAAPKNDQVPCLIMLGRIAAKRGENDKALKAFQSALSIYPPETLGFRVERSDALCQLGRFQVKQATLKEAAAAYQEAIKLRQATATATHPNYADLLKGMADVDAEQGNFSNAALHAVEALSAYL